MNNDTMHLRLSDNSIKNEELLVCLKSTSFYVVFQTCVKIIERRYCNNDIIEALSKIAQSLKGQDYRILGYQIDHLAICALFLVNNRVAFERFKLIYDLLNDDDKFFVDDFIERYLRD